MSDDLTTINRRLEHQSPEDIIAWAFAEGAGRTLTSTTFGDRSAVLLHKVTSCQSDASILWVDTGYNTPATYRYANRLIERLDLNVEIYSPEMTSLRRNVLMGGIPAIDSPLHEEFTRQVKLEPFRRAIRQLNPVVWITGIRREQNAYRRQLDVVTRTQAGHLKVAPLLNWTQADLDEYMLRYGLPNEPDYFDPTKVLEARECGLHTRI